LYSLPLTKERSPSPATIAGDAVSLHGMSLHICSIASGSNGNCYYVGNQEEAVLVDVGISCKEIEQRMKQQGLSMLRVKAIFISHEHADHVRGLAVLSKKFNLPVFVTRDTLRSGGFRIEKPLIRLLTPGEPVDIGGLSIHSFIKKHDAAEPCSFRISFRGVQVGVFTDIGEPCDQVIRHFSQCDAAFLESNYDEEMLEQGRYPYYLKKRISSEVGHLSNRQALELYLSHRPAFMTHLILSHLSGNNNTPQLVARSFEPHAGNIQMVVASRHEPSSVYTVGPRLPSVMQPLPPARMLVTQMELF
jgi:phosphoribosyl 1,2-cyclic phosphodiesterase